MPFKIMMKEQRKCQEFINVLTEFLDLDLTENRLIEIRQHLLTCRHCTKIYRDFRILIQLCRSESIEEPPSVSSQLWEALGNRFKRK